MNQLTTYSIRSPFWRGAVLIRTKTSNRESILAAAAERANRDKSCQVGVRDLMQAGVSVIEKVGLDSNLNSVAKPKEFRCKLCDCLISENPCPECGQDQKYQ